MKGLILEKQGLIGAQVKLFKKKLYEKKIQREDKEKMIKANKWYIFAQLTFSNQNNFSKKKHYLLIQSLRIGNSDK